MTIRGLGLRMALLAASAMAGVASVAGSAAAEEKIFDELRFGAQVSVADGRSDENGSFYQLTMFFDPFDNASAANWQEDLLRPRVFFGGTVASDGDEASMVYGGFAWDAYLTKKLFAEIGLGGTVHNGKLKDDGTDGPKLGCRALFREYAAIGYDVNANWRVLGQIEHSSHANLCDGPNNGVTRAGLAVGYKF